MMKDREEREAAKDTAKEAAKEAKKESEAAGSQTRSGGVIIAEIPIYRFKF